MVTDAPVLLTSTKHLLHLPQHSDTAPHTEENRFAHLSLSRFLTEKRGLYKEATGIIKASWRSLTRQIHQGHIYRFSHYCLQRSIDSPQASFKIGTECSTKYFHIGVGYSSVNKPIFHSKARKWNLIWVESCRIR